MFNVRVSKCLTGCLCDANAGYKLVVVGRSEPDQADITGETTDALFQAEIVFGVVDGVEVRSRCGAVSADGHRVIRSSGEAPDASRSCPAGVELQ